MPHMLRQPAAIMRWVCSVEGRGSMTNEPEPIEIGSAWVGVDDLPVHFANAFTGVVGPNAIFLNVGSQVPPTIESEEDFEHLRAIGYLAVKPIARLALTPQGLDDLIQALETTRSSYRQLRSALDAQEQL
jgi:hypothetical protein